MRTCCRWAAHEEDADETRSRTTSTAAAGAAPSEGLSRVRVARIERKGVDEGDEAADDDDSGTGGAVWAMLIAPSCAPLSSLALTMALVRGGVG